MVGVKIRRFNRKRNPAEVCECGAYDFPHRLFGGKCTGAAVAQAKWDEAQGDEQCRRCGCFAEGRSGWQNPEGCEVLEGREDAKQGACVLEFVRVNELKVKGITI